MGRRKSVLISSPLWPGAQAKVLFTVDEASDGSAGVLNMSTKKGGG